MGDLDSIGSSGNDAESGSQDGRARAGTGRDDIFNRVSLGRMSEVIVEQIRTLIRQGELRPGDRLPPERDLCEKFGVSRVTVREALRALKTSGLVDIRVGAHGGAFVTAPSRDRVGEGIEDYLTLSPVTAPEVTETRMVLELGIVPLVCERADEDDIADLLRMCDRAEEAIRSGKYDMHMSADFHLRVARVAHNKALELLLSPLQAPLLRSLETAREVAPEMGELGVQEHRSFVEAIRDKNVEQARDIMHTHLERTATRVHKAMHPDDE